ncbi:hypothetical protein THIOM_002129 [Candidatus Thiomargarita nelsonii]|uniref:Type I restriction enzyme R protein N-terminal domain-containing protein n=1 Tax=Candidatus Thiomargarita nelsonii TaxID=1003181 RepID=A0A176S2C5_9GAMM|nr:hypothetical protein THIOM_002129 [Candidatus Thiomargarita nelsonii]
MKKYAIISENSAYTFSDYFKLVDYRDEILDYFGYSFQKGNYELPRITHELTHLNELKANLEKNIAYVGITNEAAKREFIIAPILMDIIDYSHTKIRVEFPLTLNNQLKGTLDYYLQSKNNLLIIEAKNSDLERGFMQLAVELIALDEWTDNETPQLYGAVSTGDIWRFGILDREQKSIRQDLNLFRVPTDLEDLLRVLVAILGSP